MTANPAQLVASGITFGYPRLALFADWSATFHPGLTWIRGTNGSGKSTLLRLLGGAVDPAAGTIRIGDADAQAQPLDYRRRVYWCGPDGTAFGHLRPLEFFGFIAGLYPSFDRALATTWIDALRMEAFLPRRIDELSTGSRRKIAVIAAVASGAQAVLLDEPLAGLDQASLAFVRAHLAAAATQDRRIWLIASHESIGEADVHARHVDLPLRG